VALPNWFSHLLPEGRLRAVVSSAAGVNPKREFFLLRRLGADDLPGALRTRPVDDGHAVAPHVDDIGEAAGESDDPLLKFSLAGVQLKFSVRLDSEKGLTIPARGQAGNWIVKLPDGRQGFDGVPEAEFGCLALAREAGIVVPDTLLLPPSDVRGLPEWVTNVAGDAFAIRRFDRSDNGRIHVEEIAQILDVPPGSDRAKYRRANFETIASLIGALCGEPTVGEVIDRIVLNVLVGNGDAHVKNWAVVYPDGRTPQLSPAYDIVPTVLFIAGDDLGLKLNGSRVFEQVTRSSFDHLAIRSGWSPHDARERASEATQRTLDNWSTLATFLSRERYNRLTDRLGHLPLTREARR
jgi:serine/threonine-protein kinase HipA